MNTNLSTKQPITIEAMKNQSKGALVSLPPFCEGEELIVRLKRPSLMALMKKGMIPNSLIDSANSLFKNGTSAFNEKDDKMMEDLFELLDIICEASFVEPTYQEIRDAEIELTDEQLIFIFGYTQNGVKQLESFRG